MTSVQGQEQPARKSRASEALTDWSNNMDYEELLSSNKPGSPKAAKASTKPSKTAEAPTRPPKAPFLVFWLLTLPGILKKI